MFEDNINLIESVHSSHKGYYKEQVLLSSPDVIIDVEVKDNLQ